MKTVIEPDDDALRELDTKRTNLTTENTGDIMALVSAVLYLEIRKSPDYRHGVSPMTMWMEWLRNHPRQYKDDGDV